MQIIEINKNPDRRQIIVFGVILIVFFGLVGALSYHKPQVLRGAAMILSVAWIVSLIFNAEDRRKQLLGVLIPGLFAVCGGAQMVGIVAMTVAGVVWALGLLGAILVWIWPVAGRQLYIGWMVAAMPIGWTISHLLLAIVYYLVMTPIGLALRLAGYDPMHRNPDRSMTSYWMEHKPAGTVNRYFRQY